MKRAIPEEIWFFGRTSAYAIFIGIVYWIISHEVSGTVLLLGFGIASGTAGLVLWMELRRARTGVRPGAERPEEAIGVPFADEEGRLPQGSLAPLGVGLGVGIAMLGLVYGPWLVLAGIVLVLLSGRDWLRDISREYDAVERSDQAVSRPPARTSGR